MTRDLEALVNLTEDQIKHSFGGTPHGDIIVALVLELRGSNRTLGERCANRIWQNLSAHQEATLPWSHPQVADMIREWAGIIDKEAKTK